MVEGHEQHLTKYLHFKMCRFLYELIEPYTLDLFKFVGNPSTFYQSLLSKSSYPFFCLIERKISSISITNPRLAKFSRGENLRSNSFAIIEKFK